MYCAFLSEKTLLENASKLSQGNTFAVFAIEINLSTSKNNIQSFTQEYESNFGKRKYSSYDSFRVTKNRRNSKKDSNKNV